MRIAVCFSGQIRTWRECYESWEKLLNTLKSDPKLQKHDIQVDYFVHTWDLHTIPPHLWANNENLSVREICDMRLDVDKEELNEVLGILSPKRYTIDNIDILNTRSFIVNEKSIQYGNDGNCLLTWAAPQLYSIMKAGVLKRQYEIENNFEYDVCMKFRFDMLLSTEDITQIVEKLSEPIQDHTIYSMHSKNIAEFPYQIIGDIWFMSNSITYDLLTSFYDFLPFIQKNIFKPEVTIEEVFAYYTTMFKLHNIRVSLDPKIVRRDYSEFLGSINNENKLS